MTVSPKCTRLPAQQILQDGDQLTSGRPEVGFGRGYQPYEFKRLGQDVNESRSRYEEGLDIITKALEGGPVSHEGIYHQFPETHIFPMPVQKPHPPYWIAAQSEESTRMAVNGYGGFLL